MIVVMMFFAFTMFMIVVMLMFVMVVIVVVFMRFDYFAIFIDDGGIHFNVNTIAQRHRLVAFFDNSLLLLERTHGLVDLIVVNCRLGKRLPSRAIITQIDCRLQWHNKGEGW